METTLNELRSRQPGALKRVLAVFALASIPAMVGLFPLSAMAQSSLGDGGLSGATDALKGFIDRQKKQGEEQSNDTHNAPAETENSAPSTSHGYYPDAGTGSVREQTRRSQGAYDSVYGADGNLNCGPGCEPEGNYCHCPNAADVGGPRTPPQGGVSEYEGGGVTPSDVVGDPEWDGSGGLPGGN